MLVFCKALDNAVSLQESVVEKEGKVILKSIIQQKDFLKKKKTSLNISQKGDSETGSSQVNPMRTGL